MKRLVLTISALLAIGIATATGQPAVLKTDVLKKHVETFNLNDHTHFGQAISNEEAADWMASNVPLFECPDREIEEIHYFRWWTYRKHIKETPDGHVITEFLPKVSWSGKHNTISCPAGHHFREGRWIREPKYLNDYAVFWFRKGGAPRRYSFWAADSMYQLAIARGDFTLAIELLPDLIANYKEWEKSRLADDGLFWQIDDRDGMEVSVGGRGHGGKGKRPTINSYMFGDAMAIAAIAERAGKPEIAATYRQKAARIKRLVQEKLWDDEAEFFKVLPLGEDAELVDVREQHGYTPWYFHLPDKGKSYESAWKQLMDPKGFHAPYGPTTAERRHPGFTISYTGHECQWNGPSWPFATTVTLTALANVLNDYPQDAIGKRDWFETLKTYTKSHRLTRDDGKVVPWIDENLNPHTGDWIARTRLSKWKDGTWNPGKGGPERGKDYNHSAYCDLIVTGLAGLRPRADGMIEVNPLLPAGTWDWFCLDGIPYHGRSLTILYDKTGEKYQRGKGLVILADGNVIARAPGLERILTCAHVSATPVDDFIASAAAKHGAFGEKAARFLVAHMPDDDKRALGADFLTENLDLALKARATFPWAKDVPEAIFLNDVLPYAVFDEPRDPWRADFIGKAGPLVKEATTASEAAGILNRDFFKLIDTHYHTDRKRTNQSPKESIEQGRATCTGLSIILVAACRSVGIPARAAGTPLWWNRSGNHTWVEIWDKDWHFMGADEPNEKGLNHAWFTGHAARAIADDPRHAIYATSWTRDGGHFPMVWSPESASVGAVNVTGRYAAKSAADPLTIGIRFFEDDRRVAKQGALTTAAGFVLSTFETKAGTADLNDTPRLVVTPGESYRLRFEIDGRLMETAPFTAGKGADVHDIRVSGLAPVPDPSDDAPLSKEDAARAVALTYETLVAARREARAAELEAKTITQGDKTLRWLEKTFGDAPPGGRSLWISMHGGGEAPPRVNTQQWQNQIRLYQPQEGIYVAPRAPTDKWNMWHQEHIDPLFARLIENMVALRGVNPDKIYLMGYSAGGDGVWQLAPRMADRFAAAAMMAGHPNESSLLGLRNLPFAIFMGENDAAHKRNSVAAEKAAELAALHQADPGGYIHLSRIYPGLGHWMNRKDAEALPWMAEFKRNPWPRKIVWFQDDVVHHRFYWLRLPKGTAVKGQQLTAEVDGRKIRLTGDVPPGTQLLLSDALIDLDAPVEITINEQPAFTATPVRNRTTIRTALEERLDPAATPTASIACP